jgi:hypothetical protein
LQPLPGGALAVSRTDPRRTASVREVEQLLVDAIAAADRCIYAETQDFSSRRMLGTTGRDPTERRRLPGHIDPLEVHDRRRPLPHRRLRQSDESARSSAWQD